MTSMICNLLYIGVFYLLNKELYMGWIFYIYIYIYKYGNIEFDT